MISSTPHSSAVVARAVFGASGCGRGVMPLLRGKLAGTASWASENDSALVFVDDGVITGLVSRSVNGHDVLSYDEFVSLRYAKKEVVIAIANPTIRSQLADQCLRDGIGFFSAQAQNSILMDDIEIGVGAIISPFSTITSNVRIGRHFHCNLYSYVEHDCVIGDFVTFAPGVHCNGNVVIEDFAYVGAGAIIRNGHPGRKTVIGRLATIGMGAVVTRSVPPGATVVGNPARVLRQRSVPTC
jgi:sugar O-acyltransferase (sialic acid O-acetyltransferase NeuD family)